VLYLEQLPPSVVFQHASGNSKLFLGSMYFEHDVWRNMGIRDSYHWLPDAIALPLQNAVSKKHKFTGKVPAWAWAHVRCSDDAQLQKTCLVMNATNSSISSRGVGPGPNLLHSPLEEEGASLFFQIKTLYNLNL
jgi:hypothetical protein